MDNLRRLLGIKRMEGVPHAQIRELCGVRKCLDEGIEEGALRFFCHVETMERDRMADKIYVGECASSRSVGRPQKKKIDTVMEC